MKLQRFLPLVLLGIAAWTATPAPLTAQGTQTLVEKVRFCTGWLVCAGHTQSEYRAWEINNVEKEKQKETFISRYVEPPRASVEHVVYLSAGQQFTNGSGFNLVTGQPGNFKSGFSRYDEEGWRAVNQQSIAFRIFADGHRDAADTFAGLAFDARFNHDFTLRNKGDIADAHYDWLRSKFFAANLKSVYLAGHSRGGALMLYLAERFRRDFPDVPLIVQLFDPVLNRRQGELGVRNNKLTNPLDADFESFEFDFAQRFTNRNRLLVNTFVSGDPAVQVIFPFARSAAQRTGPGDNQVEIFDIGWFRQRYTTRGHDGVAQDVGFVNDALNHLQNRGAPMIQDYCDSRPPRVRCNVDPSFSSDDFTTATFDAFGTTSQSGAPIVSYSWQFNGSSIQVGTAPSGTGPGPHSVSFWRVGSSSNMTGTVTVTDANGNVATGSCTSTSQALGGCTEFEPCLE